MWVVTLLRSLLVCSFWQPLGPDAQTADLADPRCVFVCVWRSWRMNRCCDSFNRCSNKLLFYSPGCRGESADEEEKKFSDDWAEFLPAACRAAEPQTETWRIALKSLFHWERIPSLIKCWTKRSPAESDAIKSYFNIWLVIIAALSGFFFFRNVDPVIDLLFQPHSASDSAAAALKLAPDQKIWQLFKQTKNPRSWLGKNLWSAVMRRQIKIPWRRSSDSRDRNCNSSCDKNQKIIICNAGFHS